MTTPYNFEILMKRGLVYGYARRLAEAWQNKDDAAVERIKKHVEGNYGRDSLLYLAQLAVELIVNGEV